MRPLEGRKLWFVGIGGAGMSALALVARAWGAEVGGSDRARSSYVERLEAAGIPVAVGHDAGNVPEAAEVVVSSAIGADNPELAHSRARGARTRMRGELLAELVALRPSVVVAGAHGKTTTAGMIAFCLDRLGRDPTFLIGGEIPQLGGNARAGEGWLVAEGDESDRSLELLRPQVAVLTNVELDHHATFGSEAEVRELFDRWLAGAPAAVRGDQLEPLPLELAVPGEHNRRNAAAALAALELTGVEREQAERVLPEFRGAGRRFEARGEAAGVRLYDDYGHHPSEIAVTCSRERGISPTSLERLSPLPTRWRLWTSTPLARSRSRGWTASWSSTRSRPRGPACPSRGRPLSRKPHAFSHGGPVAATSSSRSGPATSSGRGA